MIDFSKLTKHSSLPAFSSTKKRKRKKALAGVVPIEVGWRWSVMLTQVQGPTISKEEYFNNI